MKHTFILIFSYISITLSAQTFCLEFDNASVSSDGNTFSVDVFMTGSNSFNLGDSNLKFSYDNTVLSSPTLVSSPIGPANGFLPPNITNPGGDAVSINLEHFAANYMVNQTPTLIANVSFTIIDNSNNTSDFDWIYTGGTTETIVLKSDYAQLLATMNDNTCLEPLQNIALPITLSSFTAKSVNNKDAHLDWVTESEINGSHFELERSENGVDFEQIATIQATGDAHTAQDYSYIDENANDYTRNDVVKYYRIKMVDLDGEYKYSGIRAVNFTRSIVEFSLEIFPNPTVDQVQISLEGIDNTSTERPMLQIFNSNGALIRSQELDSDLGKIDMKDMPKMVYHFIVNYNNQKHVNKVIKL